MSARFAGYKDARWVAYEAANGEMETFYTYDDAKEWLDEANDEGIAEETASGQSFIAKITHRTAMEVTDRKENYHQHTESCPEDCIEEEWPYDSDWDYIGRIYMKPIDELEESE